MKFYVKDLNKFSLDPEPENFLVIMKDFITQQEQLIMFLDLPEFILKLEYSKRKYVNQLCNLIKLLILAPAANATSERLFTELKRVKAYLRSFWKSYTWICWRERKTFVNICLDDLLTFYRRVLFNYKNANENPDQFLYNFYFSIFTFLMLLTNLFLLAIKSFH